MLQINFIRDHQQEVTDRLQVKNFDAREIIPQIINVDNQRREAQKLLDDILARSNKMAKEIGILFKAGKQEEANALKAQTGDLKKEGQALTEQMNTLKTDLDALLVQLPNLPHPSVPRGNTEDDNEIISEESFEVDLPDGAKAHWELASDYDIIDFESGSKVTGGGFPFYKGKGAHLQRGLVNFFLDEALKAGYVEFQPPLLVNEDSAYGTGQLPDKDGQMYHVGLDNLYLIPTSEVPITNIYRDVILKVDELPIKNAAFSSCFRREAGSYGKDVRGLNRLHQFDKVEIVQVQHPDKSYDTLEEMKDHVAALCRMLGLPFRILRLCGGDLSFTAALTYDFEVYSAAQGKWLEVSSVSNNES
ncbi:MAG: serine--tRNA ligase, partial [Bacteroidota bacterium]|nr:serine--tRNA ligase [Bacteroidota bacterium]